jgi:uncharacterized protein YdaT
MPWDAKSFKKKHNQSLTGAEASKAADQANAILQQSGNEGMAIATANKQANTRRRMGHKKQVRKPQYTREMV